MTSDKFVFALSYAQERLWFLEQFQPDSSLYLMEDMGVRIIGKLDLDALRGSLQTIVNRHETLRTNFDTIEGRPVQIVDEYREAQIQFFDLRAEDPDQVEAKALRIANNAVRTPLDLKTDPLFVPFLIRLSEEEHILFFIMHHIISGQIAMLEMADPFYCYTGRISPSAIAFHSASAFSQASSDASFSQSSSPRSARVAPGRRLSRIMPIIAVTAMPVLKMA